MSPGKKFLMWSGIALFVYFCVKYPNQGAAAVKASLGFLAGLANGLIRFFVQLAQ